jgi:hypothetical protein
MTGVARKIRRILAVNTMVLLGCVYCTTQIAFLVGASLSVIVLFVSLVVYYVASVFQHYSENKNSALKNFILEILVMAAVFLLCVLVSMLTFDISWDGQEYHQETIIQLVSGWNPIFGELPDKLQHALWINHYAKSIETIQAYFYLVTGSIESGKALNLILLISFGALVYETGVSFALPEKFNATISAAAILNPVILTQLFSFYVDGALACLLGWLVLRIMSQIAEQKYSYSGIDTFAAIVLLVNVKFTGLILFSIGTVIVAFYQIVIGRKKEFWNLVFVSSLSMVLFSFHPYVTNLLDYGHPFYPLFNNPSVDIVTGYSPVPFANRASPVQLILSVFSEPMYADGNTGDQPHLMIPFVFNASSLTTFVNPDPRVSGFGPMFSGVLILVVASLIVHLYQTRPTRYEVYFVPFFLLLSSLIMPEAWWARYVPQFWFFVVFTAALVYKEGRNSIIKYAFFFMIINSLLVFSVNVTFQILSADKIRTELNHIRKHSKDIEIDFDSFYSNRIRFENAVFSRVYEQGELRNDSTAIKLTATRCRIRPLTESAANIPYERSFVYRYVGKRVLNKGE